MKTADLKVGTAYAYDQRMDCRWPDRVVVIAAPVKFTTNVRGSWHAKRDATGASVAIERQVFKMYEDGHTDEDGCRGKHETQTVIETVESRWIHSTWEEWEEIKAQRQAVEKAKDERDNACERLTRKAQDLATKIGLNISSGWNQHSKQTQATINGAEALTRLIEILEAAAATVAK